MSYSNRGGGGGAPLPSGVTQEQLDEVKAFNSSITPAGNKARPGRARGGGASSRGRAESNFNSPRSGSGFGVGPTSTYTVGPTSASPIAKPFAVPQERPQRQIDVQNTRWGTLETAAASNIATGPAISPLNNATKGRSRSPTRKSILVAEPQHQSSNFQQGQQGPTNPAQAPQVAMVEQPQAQQTGPAYLYPGPGREQIVTNMKQEGPAYLYPGPGRELIVSNMKPDDPSKPFIPAHLQQPSAAVAVQEIARMCNKPLHEITSNGTSIRACRPRGDSSMMTSPTPSYANVSSRGQPDVDPSAWFRAINNKKQGSEISTAAATAEDSQSIGSAPAGLVATAEAAAAAQQPMLGDSRWAAGRTTQNGFAAGGADLNASANTFQAPPTHDQGPQNHNRVPSSQMDVDMDMTGTSAAANPSASNFDSMFAKAHNLSDSRSASKQTANNSNIHQAAPAAPTANPGFGAYVNNGGGFGQAPAVQTPGFGAPNNAGFGNPQAPASGFGQLAERHPLTEANRNGGPVNVPAHLRGPTPQQHAPAHLRGIAQQAHQHEDDVPALPSTWSAYKTENRRPGSSAPQKQEKTLKDSRWAA